MADEKKRREKKSETLQVRLPFGMKSRFLDACHRSGTTASDVLRTAIAGYLEKEERPCLETETRKSAMIVDFARRRKRMLAGGAGAVTLAALVALPSAAGPDMAAAFKRLDANGDGKLTMTEFMGPEAGDSEAVERRIEKIIETVDEGGDGDGSSAAEIEIVAETFAVLLPPEDGDVDGQWGVSMQASRSIKGGSSDEVVAPEDPRREEFDGMDTNGDGDVSLAEFQSRMRALFTRGFELLDEDGNGRLSRAEFAVSADGQVLLRRSPAGIDQDGVVGETKLLSDVQVDAGFTAMDSNRDASVSLEEYLSAI